MCVPFFINFSLASGVNLTLHRRSVVSYVHTELQGDRQCIGDPFATAALIDLYMNQLGGDLGDLGERKNVSASGCITKVGKIIHK